MLRNKMVAVAIANICIIKNFSYFNLYHSQAQDAKADNIFIIQPRKRRKLSRECATEVEE